MIPKIIHYCWFGGAPKSKLIKKCIKSWYKYCTNYAIIEWNESNFDISSAPLFVQQAYQLKKWAFVSDYARLKIIYDNGGIYLDTDVQLLNNLDKFLHHDAFFGFNDNYRIATGLAMGAVQHCKILVSLMENYSNSQFIKDNGTINKMDNTGRDSVVFKKLGVKLDNSFQMINNYAFYPKEYFCPKDNLYHDLTITSNTVAIHHFVASWANYSRERIIKRRYARLKSDIKIIKKEKGLIYSTLFAIKNWFNVFKF